MPWASVVLAVVVFLLAAVVPMPSRAGEQLPISAFFGHFVGQSVDGDDQLVSPRDLSVTIGPVADGFNVSWDTTTRDAGGEARSKHYSIDFQRSDRPDVFRSGMRTDMFGHRVPLDPMSGDPFVWARLTGRTLTVYALLIRPDGGYEMQTYERTRTPDGLDLTFIRSRDGGATRTIHGVLKQVD